MVSGIVLTLSLVIVLVVRGVHVQVDVPGGGKQFAGGNRPEAEGRRAKGEGKTGNREQGANGSVARVARVDGRWTSAETTIQRGDSLRKGQKLDLAAGEAEIVFNTGAVAVLRGPAKMEIDSSNSVRLLIGCLSVRADTPLAHGFTVHAGSASLKDLGTEFHVQAAAEGHSEVYVTAGAVVVRAHPARCRAC